MLSQILECLKEYFEWELDFDFTGWKEIKIYTGATLTEAWIKARPNDKHKFENQEFKNYVNSGNGKWLEKQDASDDYKVLLKMKCSDDPVALAGVLAHEIRHCLDYSKAVEQLTFGEYKPGNQYYYDWSEFRAVMVSFRYQFFQNTRMNRTNKGLCHKEIASLLGIWTADTMEGILCATSKQEKLYFLSRYIGAARAARNLSVDFAPASSFQLWHLMPVTIQEKYGYVFYVANEWEQLQACKLTQSGKRSYLDMLERIDNVEGNIKRV